MEIGDLPAGVTVRVAADLLKPGIPPFNLTLRTAAVGVSGRDGVAWMRGTTEDGETRTVLGVLATLTPITQPAPERVRPGTM